MSDREQQPVGTTQSFFGDFLPISKKLPAGRRTAEAFDLNQRQKKKLDSSFRWNDDQRQKLDSRFTGSAVVEQLTAMTS